MSFDFSFGPLDAVDAWLEGLFTGAPLPAALGLAALLGLRHASDPDHLIAVTSLLASDRGGPGSAARLGAWWGLGHAATLLVIGVPLILFESRLPAWLEQGAEGAVGVVIVVLAARVLLKWVRGDYRASPHGHRPGRPDHRHLHRGEPRHQHDQARTPRESFAIGLLHGLAGTGAVILLLVAALPNQFEAAAALAVFAPMSVASMAACTTAFAWFLTRRPIVPVYRTAMIPALGLFGLNFGLWYIGIV
jgi:ABC-type nickel/cobalt efflux system permease component RcnA